MQGKISFQSVGSDLSLHSTGVLEVGKSSMYAS